MSALPDVDARLAALGVRIPDVLLPADGVDLRRWSVVACDQYTSQPEYWEQVEDVVGDAPSTLRVTLPEVYLEDADVATRISRINATMRDYLEGGVLTERPHSLVLVRRRSGGGQRWGLMVALDLEAYSWDAEAASLIRATEGTILDRLPPRVRVRENAEIELPHIMVLLDDPQRRVVEGLAARTGSLVEVYDTDLMQDGGRVTGWIVDSSQDLEGVASALEELMAALPGPDPLLFAMGDGNHSFATAKSCWETLRPTLSEEQRADHPARFALVELVNIHDAGIAFEPIHRVLFGLSRQDLETELRSHCDSFDVAPADPAVVATQNTGDHRFGLYDAVGGRIYTLHGPAGAIPAATVQQVVDALVEAGRCTVDYIHGTDVTERLGSRPGNLGIVLPPVAKEAFFDAIVRDGALPRKTFSLGEANEKRYYLEARRIRRDALPS